MVPERICRRAGTEGGTKATSLMKNSEPFCRNHLVSMILRVQRKDTYEAEVQVKSVVNAADLSSARSSQVLKGNKIGLVESKD